MRGANLYKTNISEILTDGKYLLANRFLRKNNVQTINDINTDIIIEFCDSEGAGVKKVNDFLNLLTEFYIEKIHRGDLSYDAREINFWFASNEYKRFREYAKDMDIKYVDEIDNNVVAIMPSVKGMNKKKISKLIDRLEEYKTISERFSSRLINDNLKGSSPKRILFTLESIHSNPRVREIIFRRYSRGETLESIGDFYGLSRERVRQLQVLGTEEVIHYLNVKNFKEALKSNFSEESYCTTKDFYGLFNESSKHYAKLILDNYKGIFTFKELDLVCFDDNKDIQKIIMDLIGRLPKQFFIYDYLDYLLCALDEVGVKDVTINSVKQLLSISGYYLYGEYVSYYRLYSGDIFELVFKYYHKAPLKFNEEGFSIINKIAMAKLEYKISGNLRALENKLRENKNILLVDKLTFQHIKNAKIKDDVIMKIGQVLEVKFATEEIINATSIFNKHKEYFISNGIETKYKMYNLISIYFGDYYKVGRGNTLEIYKNSNVITQSKEEVLVAYLKRYGGIIQKEIILNGLSWEAYKLEDTVSKSKNLLKLGDEITTLEYLEITKGEVNALRNVVDGLIAGFGFTTGLLIYSKVKNDPKFNRLLTAGNINRSDKIASIVKKLFDDVKGHINFIYNNSSRYRNIEEVLCGTVEGRVKKEKLKEYMLSLGYKDMMISMTLNKIIENGSFYEISRDELVAKKGFRLSYGVEKKVIDFINEGLNKKGYIILSNITDYQELPVIEYKWTPYLLKSIACKNGFKSIERIYSDVRGEKIIVAREDSKIQSYDDLLIDLLKYEYKGLMVERTIYDFFADVGVVRKHRDLVDKKIPYDLKISGKIKIDEVGIVTVVI